VLITALNNERVKAWKKLHQSKYRLKTGLFMVEGMHLVLEAYKKGYVKTIILQQDELFPFAAELVYVTADVMRSLSRLKSPPLIMAVCQAKVGATTLGERLLIIDGVQDPGNLGTMIRSAVAFKIDTLIIGEGTVDPYHEKSIRASQGMIFHLPMVKHDLLTLLPQLKQEGYPLFGTRVTYGKSVKELKTQSRYALILGNEGAGLSPEIEALCDEVVYIPMADNCESLNVAIACSIILYQLS